MSNALEAASLIMVPSGYENGTLASVKPNDGTGDFTFSRGSNLSATRINEQGYIEKGYENLLEQSNTFSDAAWVKNRLSVTSGQAGYDGTNDAWLLDRDDINSNGVLIKFQSLNSVQALSVYAKGNTLNWIRIRIGTSGRNAYFDLSNGTTPTSEASIEAVGTDGWYRCSIWDSNSSDRYRIYPADGNNDTSGTSGSIYIQDAMLNQGLVAYPYIETTTAPVAGGILEDMPRLDWASGAPSLLLEPSRTNLANHSELISSQVPRYMNSIVDVTYTPCYGISPEGAKNSTRVQFADTTAFAYKAVSLSEDNTGSLYVKGTAGEDIRFGFGTTVAQGGVIHTFDGTWQRITHTSSTGVQFYLSSYTYTGNQALDFEIYGLQHEIGSYPTSYIPTYGVSQTRLAEDVELPSLSSVFDSTGSFTLFFEIERLSSSVQQQILYIRGLGYFRLDATADNRLKFVIYGGGASVSEANSGVNTFVAGTSSKIIYKQNGTIGQCFVNGQEITNVNPTILTGFFTFYQRNENHIKHKEVYFPTALSDEECIQLTTV